MATKYSEIGGKQFAGESDFTKGVTDATALCDHTSIVPIRIVLEGEATNDVIKAVRLPAGVRVVSHQSKVYAENPGTSLSFTVGDADDPDRYSAAIDVSAGGDFDFSNPGTAELAGYKVGDAEDDDRWIDLTITAASGITDGQEIVVLLAYTSQ